MCLEKHGKQFQTKVIHTGRKRLRAERKQDLTLLSDKYHL